MCRVVSPVCYLELLQAAKQAGASLGQHLPCPRLLRGPDKVFDGGYVEAGQAGQALVYPAEVVNACPVRHCQLVDVAAVGVIDAVHEAQPAYAADAPILPVAQPDVTHVVELNGVFVEQLVHGHAVGHAPARALEAPGGVAVEVVHDTLEDIVGQLQQHARLGGGRPGLGRVERVEGSRAAFAARALVEHVGREVVEVVEAEQIHQVALVAHQGRVSGRGPRGAASVLSSPAERMITRREDTRARMCNERESNVGCLRYGAGAGAYACQ